MTKRRKKKYRLKKWVKVTLWISFIISILTIASLLIFNKYQESHNKEETIPDISSLRLEYQNSDIMARIEIPDLGIDTLVTKTTDNEYYLQHDINKKKSIIGNPYIDYRNNNDFAHEKQINIYSHNVSNKQYREYYPFAKLEDLLNQRIFNKTNDITIYTDNRILKYQLYAVKIITKEDNEHMRLFIPTTTEWQNHLDTMLSNHKYCKGNCQLDNLDDILILQTCYYEMDDAYILVIAKKI